MNNEIIDNPASSWSSWGSAWNSEALLHNLSHSEEIDKRYTNLEASIDSFVTSERDYDFVIHDLKVWEDVEPDIHEIDERVVANNGKFEITINGIPHLYDASDKKWYVLFHIPKNTEHSLKTIQDTKYYVFKGKQ